MKPIIWTEQNKLFGLDYPTMKGKFHDYVFDIRFDYDGDPNLEPENCGYLLTISKNGIKLESKLGSSIVQLLRYCKNYLQEEKAKFKN
jgi:hypothetical protein